MRRRILAFFLSCLLLVSMTVIPACGAEGEVAALGAENNGSPYYIMVNRQACTVTVYGLDETGHYTVPVRAMICSVGREGSETPLGTYKITAGRRRWCYMVDGSYGQYSSQFNGHYLFHSVCYSQKDASALMTYEYNMLGGPASLGCVRLQTADAKWVYENCLAGTQVTIYDSADPGPLGKPEKMIARIDPEDPRGGWDPTDPEAGNPWAGSVLQSFSLDVDSLALKVGGRKQLAVSAGPATAEQPKTVWSSSDPEVAAVDENGTVTALSSGEAVITGVCGCLMDQVTVTVSGERPDFDDVEPGDWYYNDVCYAYNCGLMAGGGQSFFPEKALSRAMVLQILSRVAGAEQPPAAGEIWYGPALAWARSSGVAQGLSTREPRLEQAVTREELMVLLYRTECLRPDPAAVEPATLSDFADADEVYALAEEAVSWAVGAGLLEGDGDALRPRDPVSRAQAAAILCRYALLER